MAVDPTLEGPSSPSVAGAERGCALWSQASGDDVGLCEKSGGLIQHWKWLVWDVYFKGEDEVLNKIWSSVHQLFFPIMLKFYLDQSRWFCD